MTAAADAGTTPPRRAIGLHRTSAVVLVVGLVLTGGLVFGVHTSIQSSRNRYLAAQVREVGSSIRASMSSIQDPLVAAAGLGASFGPGIFRRYVSPLVGVGDPFTSASLWDVHDGRATRLAVIGASPSLPRGVGSFAELLANVRGGQELQVAGVVPGAATVLAVAARDGVGSTKVVYAEARLPSMHTLLAGGAFAGVRFVAFVAAPGTPRAALEVTSPRTPSGPTATEVTSLGSARLTVVGTLVANPPGTLPPLVPWVLLGAGLALTGAATAVTERQLRRREQAEQLAEDRGQRYEEQRGIASALQQSMRPSDLPTHDGIELAARYLPGTVDLDVGGDWYDVTPLEDGSVFLSVGDVSGHGIGAAAVMPSLRHSIRAYALQGDDPAVVLQRLRGLVDVERDHCLATVLCARLDVASQTLALALAGHPPPLLVHDGEAQFARAPVSPPVGVTVGVAAGVAAPSATYHLPDGVSILLYTDGLVERRGRALDDGMEALRVAAAQARGSLEDVVDELVTRTGAHPGADDVAVLAVRLPVAASEASLVGWGSGELMTWAGRGGGAFRTFAPAASSLRAVRRFVTAELAGSDRDLVEVASIVACELASNAIEHSGSEFVVRMVRVAPDGPVRVEVTDAGHDAPCLSRPVPTDARGRGLWLVASLAEDWGVEWAPGRRVKTVWACLGVPASATAARPAQV